MRSVSFFQGRENDLPFQKPADSDKIVDPPDRPVEICIFGSARFSFPMIDINLVSFQTGMSENGRQEAVKTVERNEKIDVVPVHRFQRASGIADAVVNKPAANCVGDPGGRTATPRILTLCSSSDRNIAVSPAQ